MKKTKNKMTLEDKIFCIIGKFVGICFVASLWFGFFVWVIERGTTVY